jgi:uncharacterized protein (DUF2147 family)
MKTTYFITILLLAFNVSSFSQRQIVGKWLSEDKEGITEIYEQAGKFYGKIVWLKKSTDDKGLPLKDTENPTPKLRQRPLLDLIVVNNLLYNNKEWSKGSVYDPKSGKTYTCKIWLSNENTLNLRGYVGLFHSTEVWTRTK